MFDNVDKAVGALLLCALVVCATLGIGATFGVCTGNVFLNIAHCIDAALHAAGV